MYLQESHISYTKHFNILLISKNPVWQKYEVQRKRKGQFIPEKYKNIKGLYSFFFCFVLKDLLT